MRSTFLALFLLAGVLHAAEIIPVAEVKPGMKGYGLTCMKAGELTRFDVEVIGIVKEFLPEVPVVLARIAHPELEKTGVFAGMSGSPVYIGERLLGAVAFTWSFTNEPVCGVTPAAEMLKGRAVLAERVSAPPFEALLAAGSKGLPALLRAQWEAEPESSLAVAPLAFHGDAFPSSLRPMLGRLGLVPAEGPAAAESISYPLQPGYPIGAALAWGDVSFFASGTITFLEGDRIHAFGHPFMGIRPAGYPLADAHSVAVISRSQVSFRFSNIGRLVGTLETDTLTGITGRLGPLPQGIPVILETGGKIRRFQAVDHPFIGPLVAAAGAASLLQKEWGGVMEGTAELNLWIQPQEGEPFEARECLSGPTLADDLNAAILFYPVLLSANPWKTFRMREMRVQVAFRPLLEKVMVEQADVDLGVVEPGQKLRLHVRFRDRKGAATDSSYEVEVPSGARAEPLSLVVGGARDVEESFRKSHPFKPKSFEGLLRLLENNRSQGDLMAVWKIAQPMLLDDDRFYPAPAPGLAARLPDAQKFPFTLVRTVLERKEMPLDGWVEIKLKVRN